MGRAREGLFSSRGRRLMIISDIGRPGCPAVYAVQGLLAKPSDSRGTLAMRAPPNHREYQSSPAVLAMCDPEGRTRCQQGPAYLGIASICILPAQEGSLHPTSALRLYHTIPSSRGRGDPPESGVLFLLGLGPGLETATLLAASNG